MYERSVCGCAALKLLSIRARILKIRRKASDGLIAMQHERFWNQRCHASFKLEDRLVARSEKLADAVVLEHSDFLERRLLPGGCCLSYAWDAGSYQGSRSRSGATTLPIQGNSRRQILGLEAVSRLGRTGADGEKMSLNDPSDERVIYRQRFQGVLWRLSKCGRENLAALRPAISTVSRDFPWRDHVILRRDAYAA